MKPDNTVDSGYNVIAYNAQPGITSVSTPNSDTGMYLKSSSKYRRVESSLGNEKSKKKRIKGKGNKICSSLYLSAGQSRRLLREKIKI